MGVKIGGEVEKVNGKELSYAEFEEKYLARNQPVVLTGLMDDWRACKDWVSGDGKPNLRFFSTHFGSSRVQVADCGMREFTDQKRVEMTVPEFIDRWLKSGSDNGGADGKSLYLKDWHFVKTGAKGKEKTLFGNDSLSENMIDFFGSRLYVHNGYDVLALSVRHVFKLGDFELGEYPDYVAYNTPIFFRDDWLNHYLDKYRMHDDPDSYQERNEISCSDYRFVYMGAKGTWTPLHADVFRSYSWSANVCGRKKWYFLSPNQNHLVFDRYMKSSVYDIFEDVCKSKYPGYEKAIWWECIQEQNEIIFVPSGWYHQVHNLEDTVSINHNWFNVYNISWVWDLLLREYHEAKGYIEDIKDICDDFEGLCQRNLAANAGMDFRDFFTFMIRFALANSVLLYQLTSNKRNINCSSSLIAQLLLYNLKNIQNTTLKMKSVAAGENHGIAGINVWETIEDQSFLEFCDAMARAYGTMYNHSELNFNQQLNLFEHFDARICNPNELIRFIDDTFKLVGTEGR